MRPLLPSRWPTLAAYLDLLPRKLDAYPECQTKGGLILSALEDHDLGARLLELPDPIQEFVVTPPSPMAWVPAVHATALFHALCDVFYPTPEAMLEWTYARTIRGALNPLYRRLLRVAGPSVMLRVLPRVHGFFQRGTEMNASVVDNRGRITMTHPRHLHSPLMQRSNESTVRAVFHNIGARDPWCTMVDNTEESATFDCGWS